MLTFSCCCRCCSLPLSGATINVIVDDDKSIKDGSVIVVPGHKEKHNTVINVPGHGKVRSHNIDSNSYSLSSLHVHSHTSVPRQPFGGSESRGVPPTRSRLNPQRTDTDTSL
jgi:hypothetical protein